MAKRTLSEAKKNKKDEFYTQISDIERECCHYQKHFRNKIIFCNCDDPEYSNFWKYFELNFDFLGLKKLVATHFSDTEKTYKLELYRNENNDLVKIKTDLEQNGDFRSPECIDILNNCDVVVTNPPFSLARDYLNVLITSGKKFLFIGNQNAITYKEFFKLIKDNKLWFGINNNKSIKFEIPKSYNGFEDNDGNKFALVPGICWFTNIEHDRRNEFMKLSKTFQDNEKDYPKYDNYDAINIDKIKDIPEDYDGHMGVPITFLHSYCPDQFEIIGQGRSDLCSGMTNMTKSFVEDYYNSGGKGNYREGNPLLCYYDNNGKAIIPYMRIIIKRKGK